MRGYLGMRRGVTQEATALLLDPRALDFVAYGARASAATAPRSSRRSARDGDRPARVSMT
jgi:hypothetical protein